MMEPFGSIFHISPYLGQRGEEWLVFFAVRNVGPFHLLVCDSESKGFIPSSGTKNEDIGASGYRMVDGNRQMPILLESSLIPLAFQRQRMILGIFHSIFAQSYSKAVQQS